MEIPNVEATEKPDKGEGRHTKASFNSACIIIGIILWSLILGKCLYENHLDLMKLPPRLLVFGAASILLWGIVGPLGRYNPKQASWAKGMDIMVHFLHFLLIILPCLYVLVPPPQDPCRVDPVIARQLSVMLSDSTRSCRADTRVGPNHNDYTTLADSLANYRKTVLLSLLEKDRRVANCRLEYMAFIDSMGTDSLAAVCRQLQQIGHLSEELNRLIEAKDPVAIDGFFRKYPIPESAKAFKYKGNLLTYFESLRNYLADITQNLEPPAHIEIVLPPGYPRSSYKYDDLLFIIR
jgi:hypothetical protein